MAVPRTWNAPGCVLNCTTKTHLRDGNSAHIDFMIFIISTFVNFLRNQFFLVEIKIITQINSVSENAYGEQLRNSNKNKSYKKQRKFHDLYV